MCVCRGLAGGRQPARWRGGMRSPWSGESHRIDEAAPAYVAHMIKRRSRATPGLAM